MVVVFAASKGGAVRSSTMDIASIKQGTYEQGKGWRSS
jgi:hypothetical protein